MGKRKSAGTSHIVEQLRQLAVAIDSVQLDPANVNSHPPASIDAIAQSLAKFAQRKPIVVNKKTKWIEAGNGTWLAAKKLGWTEIAAVFVEDDHAAALGFAVADNRTAQLAEWDDARLAEAIASITDNDPDLAAALLLDELAVATADVAGEGGGVPIPEVYAVQIECANEQEQKVLFDRLKREGRKVKALTI